MPARCEKCTKNKSLSSDEIYAKCAVCKLSFHPACTRIGFGQNFTKSKNKSWKCDECDVDVLCKVVRIWMTNEVLLYKFNFVEGLIVLHERRKICGVFLS